MNLLRRLKKSSLARDAAHLSVGQGLRLLIQAAYFVLIARSLGPDSFGAFVAIVAMAATVAPFAGLGTPNLFIKNVRSGKRSAAYCWGNGLLLTTVSGMLLALLVLAVSKFFQLNSHFLTVLIVCISELVCMKITELASFGFAAAGKFKDSSILTVVISLFRLAGIAGLAATVKHVSLNQWSFVYLFTSLLGSLYAITRSGHLWGRPRVDLGALREDVAEGVFFSISTSATSIYNDVDKVMLSKLSDFASTGIYGAAYRIIDVSMTPVRSLVSAAYPEFFRRGVDGAHATYAYALRLIKKSAIYGAFLFLGLWVAAPLLPMILGPGYINAVSALRWLALIPLLRCSHVFLADSLSGAGYQRTRAAIQVFVGLVNVVLNYFVLPVYSWRGAAWTSLFCDGMLAILFWTVAAYLAGQDRRLLPSTLHLVDNAGVSRF